MSNKSLSTAAIITIRRPNEMTKRGAKDVAAWLRKSANFLERYHREMAKVMRYRYLTDPRSRENAMPPKPQKAP